MDEAYLKSTIRTIVDWPKTGIMFRDITTLFENPRATRMMMDSFTHRYMDMSISHIAALEARGFLVGSTLAYLLNKPLVILRKKGKLPAKTLSQDYDLEYGKATIEIHSGSLTKGDRVLLTDDLIATGGTLLAAAQLVRASKATTVEAAAIIDLPELGGSASLRDTGLSTFTLCTFEGQ